MNRFYLTTLLPNYRRMVSRNIFKNCTVHSALTVNILSEHDDWSSESRGVSTGTAEAKRATSLYAGKVLGTILLR